MSWSRAKSGGERDDNNIIGQAIPNIEGNNKGRTSLRVGRMSWELDQVNLSAEWI